MSRAEAPRALRSQDGRRLRLLHGPIDAIFVAAGAEHAVRAAQHRVATAFRDVLTPLARDLPRLRATTGPMPPGRIAQAMVRTTQRFAPQFVTPMAAVAGAVADHLLTVALCPGHGLTRAHVNNGGDIALWLDRGQGFDVAICEDPAQPRAGGMAHIAHGSGIGGIATSGWRGRSYSLGIADAVTVLARDAAHADAAATLIANAVDLPGHPAITRAPACDLSPDSDLGGRRVTTAVGPLIPAEINRALSAGLDRARAMRAAGLIVDACLALGGERRMLSEIHEEELSLA
ncbi:MAG: UPF0280 family protein [Celeribacter sp.]|jgi:ApbE superfamily uncharacterized protein (UPF0280 family)